jgi:hypothetical protein
MKLIISILLIVFLIITGCVQKQYPDVSRESVIPKNATKVTPETDLFPPILHSNEYHDPIPLSSGVNSKGGEDSPFITPDGKTMYFFFTPDVSVPPQLQVIDNVTGIWVSKKINGVWGEAERVHLIEPGELSLDGCEFVQGKIMWFCSVRKGNHKEIDFYTAEFKDGNWTNWKNAGKKLNVDIKIGEMHMSADGTEIYYHSGESGKGGYDLFVTKKVNGEWQAAQNLKTLNTELNEGWPYLSQDGSELWFTRFHQGYPAIFRSKKVNGSWGEPELILSQFAAESTLDNEGNIYFAHHFFENGTMIEADIYVAKKK